MSVYIVSVLTISRYFFAGQGFKCLSTLTSRPEAARLGAGSKFDVGRQCGSWVHRSFERDLRRWGGACVALPRGCLDFITWLQIESPSSYRFYLNTCACSQLSSSRRVKAQRYIASVWLNEGRFLVLEAEPRRPLTCSKRFAR